MLIQISLSLLPDERTILSFSLSLLPTGEHFVIVQTHISLHSDRAQLTIIILTSGNETRPALLIPSAAPLLRYLLNNDDDDDDDEK